MTRILTRQASIGRWRAHLEFKLQDMWVGIYWADHSGFRDVWVCLFPCFPIHVWSEERI